jgi:hypothetical protein
MPGLTRFKQRHAGGEIDGPVSGAIVIIPVQIDVAASTTKNVKIDLPAGCRFRLTDATFRASQVLGVSTLKLGLDVIGSTTLVNTVTATSNLGALTVKTASQDVPAGSVIIAQLAATLATRAIVGGVLTLVGHVSAPPASMVVRNASHY